MSASRSNQAFSERFGFSLPREVQRDELELGTRNRLWNVVWVHFLCRLQRHTDTGHTYYASDVGRLALIWDQFLKVDLSEYKDWDLIAKLKKHVLEAPTHHVFDLFEFLLSHIERVARIHKWKDAEAFERELNRVLTQEVVAWRLVGGVFAENLSPLEMEAVATALESPVSGVRGQLQKAVHALRGEQPDYGSAVKQAISAVETMLRHFGREQDKDLRANLKVIEKRGTLHPALSGALDKFYGWTSALPGARHGDKSDDKTAKTAKADAILAVVLCSAAINYFGQLLDQQPMPLNAQRRGAP